MDRLEAAVKRQGHDRVRTHRSCVGAAEAGLTLRPTELLIFGNARGGTPLMQAVQTMGIDLPLKALVWQDAAGDTWLSWNEPRWLARRHGSGQAIDVALGAMSAALAALAEASVS